MTCSFWIMCVSTQKCCIGKRLQCVFIAIPHQSSFCVQIICIHCAVLELCVREERRKRKKSKIQIFMFNFLNCEKNEWNSGVYFTLEYLRVSSIRVFDHSALVILELFLHLMYRTPFFYLSNPYLRSTIVILDISNRDVPFLSNFFHLARIHLQSIIFASTD